MDVGSAMVSAIVDAVVNRLRDRFSNSGRRYNRWKILWRWRVVSARRIQWLSCWKRLTLLPLTLGRLSLQWLTWGQLLRQITSRIGLRRSWPGRIKRLSFVSTICVVAVSGLLPWRNQSLWKWMVANSTIDWRLSRIAWRLSRIAWRLSRIAWRLSRIVNVSCDASLWLPIQLFGLRQKSLVMLVNEIFLAWCRRLSKLLLCRSANHTGLRMSRWRSLLIWHLIVGTRRNVCCWWRNPLVGRHRIFKFSLCQSLPTRSGANQQHHDCHAYAFRIQSQHLTSRRCIWFLISTGHCRRNSIGKHPSPNR